MSMTLFIYILQDQHLDVIQLDIPKQTTSVSEIFRVLEREKENYNILYYTVSQNTLETVSTLNLKLL